MGTTSFSFEIPKQHGDIITDSELFNSEELTAVANELDSYFEEFSNTLNELNDLIFENVNVPDGCVFAGGYGAQLLSMWDENASTFSEFKANFNAWSQVIAVIAAQNLSTQAIVQAIYNNRTTGADVTTVSGQSIADVRQNIMLEAAEKSDNNTGGGTTYTYYNDNGELVMRYENADGDVYMQHTKDANGHIVSTTCTDAYGNTSRIEFVRDDSGKLVEKNVSYYDKDGNKLDSSPDTFDEDGYLINNKTGVAEGAWTSFEDAAAAGHSNILTESEFAARNNNDGYVCTDADGNKVTVNSYQEYLDVMQGKYSETVDVASSEASTSGVQESASSGDSGSGVQGTTSDSVTVSSGQKVNVKGKDYYYLMTDGDGKNYYTLSNDGDAQVYVDGENGPEVYTQSNGEIVSRDDFVDYRKNNRDYSWSATYNNGTSPFDSVGSTDTVNFDGVSSNTSDNSYVVNNIDSIKESAVPLSSINFGEVKIGNEKLPDVIYVAPGDDIRWDPFDFLDQKDIHIEGGTDGKYLVLDPSSNTYYTVNNDGTFHADGGDNFSYSDISYDRLVSGDTNIDAD